MEFTPFNLEQLSTPEGVLSLNEMIRALYDQGKRATFQYSLSASTSADAYAKWGEVTGTSSIGLRMPKDGSIIHHSCLLNLSTATSGDVTAEVRINDANKSDLEIAFASTLGTGVTSSDVEVDRHAVTFTRGDLIQIFLNETGTMVWDSVIGHIEVVFDE